MNAFVHDPTGAAPMAFTTTAARPSSGSLRDGHILVDVHAVALNPVDYKLASIIPFSRFLLGGTPVAQDYAGVVLSSRAPGFAAGDKVFGHARGCLAEAIVAPASSAALMPPKATFVDAASLVTAALTSIQALERAGVGPGSRVLVVGAAGGVGATGVQAARALVGATGFVAGVCSAASAALVRGLGADAVVDYQAPDALEPLRALPPFDAVFDTVTSPDKGDDLRGTPYPVAVRPFLKPSGKVVTINGSPRQWVGALVGWHDRGVELVMERPDAATLGRAAAWVGEGRLRAVIDSTFPFTAEGCAAAFEKLKSRRAKGKIVVRVVEGADDGASS